MRKTISNYDCGDCKYHGQCRGGCQVRKYVEEGTEGAYGGYYTKEDIADLISREMQSVAQLSVPLTAEAKFGKGWYEAK